MKIPIFKSKILIISALATSMLIAPASLTAQGEENFFYYASLYKDARLASGNSMPRLNEIPAVASRHLVKNYQRAADATWTRKSGGYVASFEQQGNLIQVNYDQVGNFQYSVRFLEFQALGTEICRQITKTYPSYTVDIVAEIKSEFRTEFILTLKNEFSMKGLMISNGQVRVIDDLVYATR
jgi:hypothetical protein